MHHIASAAEEFTSERGVVITRSSTLLIDDDCCNVDIALANSVRALLFAPDAPETYVESVVSVTEQASAVLYWETNLVVLYLFTVLSHFSVGSLQLDSRPT